MKKILETVNVTKYFLDPVKLKVLSDISFAINEGSFVSIIGKSGCGKSTLLYILSTMDTDYEGELYIDGEPMHQRNANELARVRNEKIGFVFQFHYLLQEFSVLKNVMLPALKLGKLELAEIEHSAMLHLKALEMDAHANKQPNQLSGGQKQRVAIARALINDPLIIMADEPTGNLDKKNSEVVLDIFRKLSSDNNRSILVVTHDPDFANKTSRTIEMQDGKILKSFENY